LAIYREIDRNRRSTWLWMFFFVVLVAAMVEVIALALGLGSGPAIATLIVASIYVLIAFEFSDRVVLGMSEAREVTKTENPELYNLVENLCIGAGMPVPKIYIIDDTAPNAFATGRDPKHAYIVVTKGLLQKLNKLELEGVLAHELSHIRNYDIRLMTVIVMLVGLVALLAAALLVLRGRWDGRIFLAAALLALLWVGIRAASAPEFRDFVSSDNLRTLTYTRALGLDDAAGMSVSARLTPAATRVCPTWRSARKPIHSSAGEASA
jgi:Zn-dependent protease with chaperone function